MTLQDTILDAIKAHDMNRPRGLQTAPGPSDIAQDCDHCLAAKLAGWVKRPEPAWLAYIGTAVHAQLEEAMAGHHAFEREVRVTVGHVGPHEITGHADLFDTWTGTVVDYKTVGKTKLDAVRRGSIPENYRRQVHLYAKGLRAHAVAILFLPRNEISLDKAVWWEEEYNPAIAAQALWRAQSIYLAMTEEGSLPGDFLREKGCYDCGRYPDAPGAISGTLESLIGA